MEKTAQIVNHSSPKCPYCHDSVTAESEKTACESCMAWHHLDCWREHGACSTCQHVRADERETQLGSAVSGRKVCSEAGCTEFALNKKDMGVLATLCMTHGVSRAQRSEAMMLALTLSAVIGSLMYFMMSIGDLKLESGVFMAVACAVVGSIWGSILLWQRKFHRKHLKDMTKSKKPLK
ncbi:MAG: hypothetical protein P1V97_19175 [Planctomycetota bacterium]|nr:hypothetical protein [Planctomycetota bacterium]